MTVRPVPDGVFDELGGLLWLAKDFEVPLARTLTAGGWSATALVGAGVPPERLVCIREGGLGGGGAGEDAVVALIDQELRVAPGATFLALDGMMRSGDGALARAKAPHVEIGDTIAYPVPVPDPVHIRGAWLQAASPAGQLGLLTTRADGETLSAADIVGGTFLVVFPAYDGEGALVLTRR